jgi:hypothetical protein
MVAKYGVSERLALRAGPTPLHVSRKIPKQPEDEVALTADISALATRYNTVRPYAFLGYRPPAPEIVVHASKLAPRPT